MPRQENKNKSSSPLVVAAAIGVGALAAVGSYFLGKQHGETQAQEQRPGCSTAPPRRSSHTSSSSSTPRHQPVSRATVDCDDDDPCNEKQLGYQENRECGICFRSYEQIADNNEEIHTTPCGHIYCSYCLNRALERDPKCPFCRREVDPSQTLRIFI